jgi:hypothetical protein
MQRNSRFLRRRPRWRLGSGRDDNLFGGDFYRQTRSTIQITPAQQTRLNATESAMPEIAPQLTLRPLLLSALFSAGSESLSNHDRTNPISRERSSDMSSKGAGAALQEGCAVIFLRGMRVLDRGDSCSILLLKKHLLV